MEIHKNLTKKQMKELEKRMFDENEHKDASCTALFVISHGTMEKGESFIRSTDSIERLERRQPGGEILRGQNTTRQT